MTLRRVGVSTLIAGLVLGLYAVPAVGDDHDGNPVDITLLHDTHFHGNVGDDEPRSAACVDDPDSAGFTDVAAGNVHLSNIDCAASLGILQGIGDDLFNPAGNVTRAQAATLVAKSLEESGVSLPDAPDPFPFDDAAASVHASSIGSLAELGVIRGRTDGSFGPSDSVTRGQLATMLVQAAEIGFHTEVSATDGPHFEDTSGSVHEANIDAAFELGLVSGKTATMYDPSGSATRAQAATLVVHLADEVLPTGPSTVNVARYMQLVNDLKTENPNSLFIGNGDDLAPSVLSSVFGGEHMIEILNASPIDVNTLGNHEFDFGPENLRERIEDSDFPWVSANVRDVTTGEPFAADLDVERFIIEEIEGVSVGITGLGPERMAEVTTLGDDTEQISAITAMEEVVPEMEAAGADVIVVASHLCGPDARELAAQVDGIDAIVGDHCAEVLDEPEEINGTLVSFVGDEFDLLGQLTLTVDDGEVVDHDFTLHDITHVHQGDATVQAIVDDWEVRLDEALDEEIGTRLNAWDVRSPDPIRREESGFANYIVDTMRDEAGADVALTNGGGIRSDQVYEPGPIIRRDVIAILPFANNVVKVELDGASILEALENGVSRVEDGDGRFPHVSGMAYVWDPDADPGERIVSVTIGGEPLDEDADYTLATNDFLLDIGGDGYDMLDRGETLISSDEGRLMSDVVSERIVNEVNVEVETDGRISTVD